MATTSPKGWCPSLFEPMMAGDGLLARIKPGPHGLSAPQLRAVATAAGSFGSGRLEITNRANLQLRGLRPESIEAFAAAMLEAGLAYPDPGVERRRNILLPACPAPSLVTVACGLERWLVNDASVSGLPAKFGYAVAEWAQETGQPEADIQILLARPIPRVGLAGTRLTLATDDSVEAARALTRAFLELAAAAEPKHRRMRSLVAAQGAEAVFAQAGLRGEPVLLSGERPAARPVGAGAGFCVLGLPFGAAGSAMLCALTDRAEEFGADIIRLTAARGIVLLGDRLNAAGLALAAARLGFLTDPEDARLQVAACVGRPACPSAQADVRQVAEDLAPLWRQDGHLHVSGCAKGCAYPGAAAVTLVATETGYDLLRGGRIGAVPLQTGLDLPQAAQAIRDLTFQPA